MSVAKIITATTLTSLSGVLLYSAMQGLLTESSDRSTDDEQDAIQPKRTAISNSKGTISKPEKLTTRKNSTALVAQPERSSPSLIPASIFRPQLNDNTAPPEAIPANDPSRLRRMATPSSGRSLSRNDITGHWAEYYIEALVSRSVVQGFPDGSFRPNQAVTETEFATMTQLAFQGNPASSMTYGALKTALNHAPSRAEAAAFIYRGLIQSEPTPIVTSIQVSGEVVRPGAYSLAALNDVRIARANSLPTVFNAIRQAGGSLATADLQQVEIHRTGDNGKPKVIRVNVSNAPMGDRRQDVLLQQDDRLVIRAVSPTAQQPADPTKLTELHKPIETVTQSAIDPSDPSGVSINSHQ